MTDCRCVQLQTALDEAGETISRLGHEADQLATVANDLAALLVAAQQYAARLELLLGNGMDDAAAAIARRAGGA
jgi:hypothetical protein